MLTIILSLLLSILLFPALLLTVGASLSPDSALIAALIGSAGAVVQGLIPTDMLNAAQKRLLALVLSVLAGGIATVAAPDFVVGDSQDLLTAVLVALAASQTAYALLLSKLTEFGWLGLKE